MQRNPQCHCRQVKPKQTGCAVKGPHVVESLGIEVCGAAWTQGSDTSFGVRVSASLKRSFLTGGGVGVRVRVVRGSQLARHIGVFANWFPFARSRRPPLPPPPPPSSSSSLRTLPSPPSSLPVLTTTHLPAPHHLKSTLRWSFPKVGCKHSLIMCVFVPRVSSRPFFELKSRLPLL